MNIHIAKDYWVKSDSNQFILYRLAVSAKGKNEGEEYETEQSFFGSIENACSAVLDKLTRQSDCTTVEELRQFVLDTKNEILQNVGFLTEAKEEVKKEVKRRVKK